MRIEKDSSRLFLLLAFCPSPILFLTARPSRVDLRCVWCCVRGVLMSGWVRKKRQRRWVLLAGGNLHWFTTEVAVPAQVSAHCEASERAFSQWIASSFSGVSEQAATGGKVAPVDRSGSLLDAVTRLRRSSACRGVLALDPCCAEVQPLGKGVTVPNLSFPGFDDFSDGGGDSNNDRDSDNNSGASGRRMSRPRSGADGTVSSPSGRADAASPGEGSAVASSSPGPSPDQGQGSEPTKSRRKTRFSSRLSGHLSKATGEFGFKIVGTPKGDYLFRCANAEEANRWCFYLARELAANRASMPPPLATLGPHEKRAPPVVRDSPVSSLAPFAERGAPRDEQIAWEKQGMLVKKGKKRFFRLSGAYLLWHTSDTERDFRGSLNLTGCQLDYLGEGNFTISSFDIDAGGTRGSTNLSAGDAPSLVTDRPDSPVRFYELAARTVVQAKDWVARIQRVVDDLSVGPLEVFANQHDCWPVRCSMSVSAFDEMISVDDMFLSRSSVHDIKQAMMDKFVAALTTASERAATAAGGQRQSFVAPQADHFFLGVRGSAVLFFNEALPLSSSPIFRAFLESHVQPELEMVPKSSLQRDHGSIQEGVAASEQAFDFNAYNSVNLDVRWLLVAPLTENSPVHKTPGVPTARSSLVRFAGGNVDATLDRRSVFEADLATALLDEAARLANHPPKRQLYDRYVEVLQFRQRMATLRCQLRDHELLRSCDAIFPEILSDEWPSTESQRDTRIFLNIRFPESGDEGSLSTKVAVDDWSTWTLGDTLEAAVGKYAKFKNDASVADRPYVLKFVGKQSFAVSRCLPMGCFLDLVEAVEKVCTDGRIPDGAPRHVLLDVILCERSSAISRAYHRELLVYDNVLAQSLVKQAGRPASTSVGIVRLRIGQLFNIKIRNLFDNQANTADVSAEAAEGGRAARAETDVASDIGDGSAPSDLAAQSAGNAEGSSVSAVVLVELVHGTKRLGKVCVSRSASFLMTIVPGRHQVRNSVSVDQWLSFGLKFQDLPRAARFCITVFATLDGRQESKRKVADSAFDLPGSDGSWPSDTVPPGYRAVAWLNFPLFESQSQFRGGLHYCKLWSSSTDCESASPVGTSCENTASLDPTCLTLELDRFPDPAVHPLATPSPGVPEQLMLDCARSIRETYDRQAGGELLSAGLEDPEPPSAVDPDAVGGSVVRAFQTIVERDALAPILDSELEVLWHYRNELCASDVHGTSLPKFLQR
jgi:Phosphoinositide 3-kinase C2/PH domain